jgi:hypothetical protein
VVGRNMQELTVCANLFQYICVQLLAPLFNIYIYICIYIYSNNVRIMNHIKLRISVFKILYIPKLP